MTRATSSVVVRAPERASDRPRTLPESLPDLRDKPDWLQLGTLVFMHAGCLGVLWVGWSWTAVGFAALLYRGRAFGLTAFYHRHFSCRAIKISRWFQREGALLGCMALQKGPLWSAAHHREHYRSSDREGDVRPLCKALSRLAWVGISRPAPGLAARTRIVNALDACLPFRSSRVAKCCELNAKRT